MYYRYGAFSPRYKFNKITGEKEVIISDNKGNYVVDKKKPNKYKPDWILDPVIEYQKNITKTVFNREIYISKALKQTGKGGVYYGKYQGEVSIIKEGRKNFQWDNLNRTITDRHYNEYIILKKLSMLDGVPRAFDYFKQNENSYLIMQYLEGESLRKYILKCHHTSNYADLNKVVECLKQLVSEIHDKGIVLRDLSPNNILVNNSKTWIIDYENAAQISDDTEPFSCYTPGYVPSGCESEKRLDVKYDYYSLGSIIYFIATSIDPYFPNLDIEQSIQKLTDILNTYQHNPQLYMLGKYGLEIMEKACIDLGLLKEHIYDNYMRPLFDLKRDSTEYVDFVYKNFNFESKTLDKFYSLSRMGESFHPLSFNYGIGGIVSFFIIRYVYSNDTDLLEKIERIVDKINSFIEKQEEFQSCSLYFGIGCYPLILAKLYTITKKQKYLLFSKYLSEKIMQQPMISNNISHGRSGLGLMFLKCYTETHDELFLDFAYQMGTQVVCCLERNNNRIFSEEPIKRNGKISFYHPLGYSHGIAGIGYFLTMLYKYKKETIFNRVIEEIFDTLYQSKITRGDSITWSHELETKEPEWIFWCNGSTGIGWFLLEYVKANKNCSKGIEALSGAVQSIINSEVYESCCLCHGLSGTIEFLNRLKLEGNHILNKNNQLLERLYTLISEHKNLKLWISEDGEQLNDSFMTGNTGIYSTLMGIELNINPFLSF